MVSMTSALLTIMLAAHPCPKYVDGLFEAPPKSLCDDDAVEGDGTRCEKALFEAATKIAQMYKMKEAELAAEREKLTNRKVLLEGAAVDVQVSPPAWLLVVGSIVLIASGAGIGWAIAD